MYNRKLTSMGNCVYFKLLLPSSEFSCGYKQSCNQRAPENKKETYRKWKEGQARREEYTHVARNRRHGIRRAKAENVLRLARDIRSNNKAFFRYMHSKRQNKTNK